MRILLTGITGHIGGALLPRLQSLGEVIGTDRKLLDFSRPSEMVATLDAIKPDLIVNPASYNAVDHAETERDLAFTVNANAPEILARWAKKNSAPIVHFSTDYVFDGSGEKPWREDDIPAPLSIYGHSKLAGENAVRAADGVHLIIRTSWVYASTGNNFLQKIIAQARTHDTLSVVDDQFGAPTSAHSIADLVPEILAGGKPKLALRFGRLHGVIHIANRGATSRHGFATAILDGLGRRDISILAKTIVPIGSMDSSRAAARPRNSRLDLSRLEDTLGLTMPHWQTALDDELDRLKMPGRSAVLRS